MAYFRCVGGVGGGAVLTLTYSSEFYGQTITATDGTKTVTKVAPSTGTMDITLPESGTWVVNATIDGQTYSTTVTVDIGYSATLFAIPNGSTVTPTDDIQTWLKCAGITDKTTYTTLSDVLSDTDTLIALCADSNACDYMARSTNWASGVAADSTAMLIVGKYNYCANKLIANNTWFDELAESDYWEYVFDVCVPKMTSNTAPSGECFAKDVYSGQNIYAAFDRNPNIGCHTSTPASVVDWYIGYKFTHSVKVYGIAYRISQSNSQAISFTIKLQGTKDGGSTWTDLTEVSTLEIPAATPITGALPVTKNLDNYDWYRIYTNGKGVTPLELQFLGHTDNANYIPLVPRMTSDTTPSGVCSASSNYNNNYLPYMAFNGSMNNFGWLPANDTNQYIDYEFDTPIIVHGLGAGFYYGGSQNLQVTIKIQGANSGSFEDITDNLTFSAYNSFDFFNFSNDVAYKKYRILLISTTVSHFYNIGDGLKFQFYRKSDLPIIHSAVEDSIFYMDDGSPVALCTIASGDTETVLASTIESLKNQTITLYSSVAKDPTNLSNDYSKQIRITPNITEIYLMPDLDVLYWWGSTCDYVTGGWSASGYKYGSQTNEGITSAKNCIPLTKPSGSGNQRNYGTVNTVDISGKTTLKMIKAYSGGSIGATDVTISGSGSKYIAANSEDYGGSYWQNFITESSSKSLTSNDFKWNDHNSSPQAMNIYAFLLEA